jgi:hypothetical protein
MPLPDLCQITAEITPGPSGLCVTLPGGNVICAQLPSTMSPPSGLQLSRQLIAQVNAALAPLAPVFSIIEVLLALKKFADAVPDSLGPPPDPTVLVEAIEELTSKVDKILALVPQLSVPLMVVGIIDAIIQALDGLVSELEALQEQLARIEEARLVVAEVPALQCVIDAGELNVATQFSVLEEALGALSPFIELVNAFLDLIGLPPLPLPGAMDPDDLAASIQVLRDLVTTLQTIRGSIPV